MVWKTHFTVKVKYTSIFCTCYFSLFSLCIGRMCLIMMANAIWIKFKFMVWTFFPIAIACHRFNIFHPQSLIFFSSSSLLCVYNVQLEKIIKAKFVRKKETHAGSQAQEFSWRFPVHGSKIFTSRRKQVKILMLMMIIGRNGTNDLDLMLNAFAFFIIKWTWLLPSLTTIHILINRSKHEQK